jgi:SagB-type dehydrogenase family enzyme
MEIDLAKPRLEGKMSLEECIYYRESVRSFQGKEIELEKISQLLWGAQAIKNSNRTVPSAGATYPLEFYVNIKGKGVFYYNFKERVLEQEQEEDLSHELASDAFGQQFIAQAPLNIIICADYSRTCNRYGNRGRRYVHMEVGHCAQNIHLEAVSLGLASVPIGAFQDHEVKNTLNLPTPLDPLYIIPIGYAK